MPADDSRPTAPVLTADAVERTYTVRERGRRRSVHAVDGVSLTVDTGETVAVVGESGCGKSTLVRVLLGLDRATAGSVRFEGTDLAALDRAGTRAFRRSVQLVMQDPYASLDPRMTVGDAVAEPLRIHRRGSRAEVSERVRELAGLVGLDPTVLDRYPHEFSGGQRQRVSIARALALEPRVLVCDEPVSALDVSIQAQVMELLGRLQDELGVGYLIVAHDLSVVRQVADRVVVMYLGRVVEEGPCDEVFAHPQHPYTRALLSAAPLPDPTRRDRPRLLLEGDLPSPTDRPDGCRFRTRCPLAEDLCAADEPALEPAGPAHVAACHFAPDPVTAGA